MKTVSRLLIVMTLAAMSGSSQNVTSSVKGSVTDSSGAVIPGASCVLSSTGTGQKFTALTVSDGSFTFPSVSGGTYSLQVTSDGFKALTLKGIIVTSNETRTVGNVVLELGTLQESVSVVADPASVQLVSAEKSGLISGQQLNDIAIRGRDFFAFLQTLPGVTDTFEQRRESTSPDSIRGTNINGSSSSHKNFTLDGITNLDTGSNSSVHVQPNMESIAEVKVLTSNYSAEFGRSGGGLISVVTKSGTQQFHGSGYDFYRHESLNANSFFNNRNGTKKIPYRYRISGYSFGGPIFVPGKFNTERTKLFAFWSQEFTGSRVNYGTKLVTTPTDLERRGDFSRTYDVNGALIPIRDPATNSPFAGNIIPTSRVSKLGSSILNFYPAPNFSDPSPGNLYRWNYRSAVTSSYTPRQEVLRLDGNPSQKWNMYYRYITSTSEQTTPYGLWVNGGMNYPLSPVYFTQPGNGHVGHITTTITPTLMNDFRVGLSHNNLFFDVTQPEKLDRSLMGNPVRWYQHTYPSANYIPLVNFGSVPANAISSNIQSQAPYVNYNDIYSFVDNLSKVWGRHSLKAGVYVERTFKRENGSGTWQGQFDFSRDTNNPFDTNHAFSNAMLGNFASYTETTQQKRLDMDLSFWNTEWYVQDNWRVSSRLTLDVGLRVYHTTETHDANNTVVAFVPSLYDPKKAPALYRPAFNEAGKRVAQDPISGAFAPATMIGLFVPGSGDPANGAVAAGRNGIPDGTTFAKFPRVGFGPRVGFAYDLFGNGKTALRGGIGTFQDRPPNLSGGSVAGPPIAYSPTLYYGSLDTYTQSGGLLGPASINTGAAADYKMGRATNFSLGFQQQVWNTVIDASYVGMISRHDRLTRPINYFPMYARFDPANQDPTRPGSPLPDVFLRDIKGYQSISRLETSGTTNYHSAQLSANRRFTRGLQFGLAYTFAKGLGISDGFGVSGYFPTRQRSYGVNSFDRTHVFVLNYMYDVPKLGQRLAWKPASWVLDNWQVSGITSFMSGTPFTPSLSTTDGQDITGSLESARITVLGSPILDKSEKTFFRNFKTEMFARTPKYSFGNAGLGMLRGPGVNNWDISASKRFPLRSDQRYIQFRTEMFNAWNHTQFNGLVTGARFDPAGKQVDANFGSFSSARDPRMIQLSLKVIF